MLHSVKKLLGNRKVFHSREGEDGLLAFILSKIPDKSFWSVELGAWDGISESNTYYFISQKKYQAIMIEADPLKFTLLKENMKNLDVFCFNIFVRPDGKSRLDNILAQTSIPKCFDLLSIDVDGDDYYIWQSIANYQPKVVIIEISFRDKPGIKRVIKPAYKCTNYAA